MRLLLLRLQLLFILSFVATCADAQVSGSGRFAILFNQPKYAPGDTVFFSIFNLVQDLPKKIILDLQLQGADGSIVVNERVLSDDGIASGQFLIAEQASPGLYNFVIIPEDGFIAKQARADVTPFRIVGQNEIVIPDSQAQRLPFDTTMFQIKLNKQVFETRDRVEIQLKSKSPGKSAKYAIAVFKSDLLNGSALMTTSSIPSDFSPLPDQKRFPIPYYFAGRVINEITSEPLPDSSKITFYLSESAIIYSVYSKKDGYFVFPLFKNFSTENLFYSISKNGVNMSGFKIQCLELHSDVRPEQSNFSNEPDQYALYSKRKNTVRKAYQYRKGNADIGQDQAENEFVSDHEVVLDNLGPFSNMEEMILNVVPMTKVRSNGIRIFLKKDAKYADASPLYLVDGFMTDDTEFILKLDPETIRKISVLRTGKSLLRFGELGKNGMLIIETSTGTDPAIFQKNFFARGLLPQISSSHSKPDQNRYPTLQSALLWKGEVSPTNSASYHFDTADDLGKYIIYAVCLNEGKIFITTASFEVAVVK